MPAIAKAPKGEKKAPKRPVIHPALTVEYHLDDDRALTVKAAKELLGWREANEGEEALFTDLEGKKIVTDNNLRNRPFDRNNALRLSQEILNLRWKINAENMIIGKTGQIISAQHRLVGLVFAAQELLANPDKYPQWKEGVEPTLKCLIAVGAEEDDETVNTVDTGKIRSLGDVIFRSEMFKALKPVARREVSKVCDKAVRRLWYRVGVGHAFSKGIRSTHSEYLAFIARHPRILEAVKRICDANKDGKLTRILMPGPAAAMLYLMGSSGSKGPDYFMADVPSEELLTWARWPKACSFWAKLAANDKAFSALKSRLGKAIVDDGHVSDAFRLAIVAKAWLRFIEGKSISAAALELDYQEDASGIPYLAECPIVGGIDLGQPQETPSTEEAAPEAPEKPRKGVGKAASPAKALKLKVGDAVWVEDGDGVWKGTLEELGKEVARVKVAPKFAGAGKVYETSVSNLREKKPA